MSELADLTIHEASRLMEGRKLSPTELTEAVLGRIESLDPTLNSYIRVLAGEARAQARTATDEIAAGTYRGPLHGIPIGLKDLYDLEGQPTTAGTSFLKDNVAAEDAPTVAGLRAAGAVFTGKLNLHEFAFGADTVNAAYGACHNPWDPDRICGGSSGGSGAAVAAGLCLGATGSDTGGSIRIPASLCGIVGFKPTRGLLSTRGLAPLAWTLDHPGPMTRSVEDAALMLNAMSGFDALDPQAIERPAEDYAVGLDGGVDGLKVGVPSNHFFDDLGAGVENAVRSAADVLAKMGAEVREVAADLSAAEGFVLEAPAELELPPLRGVGGMWLTICCAETYVYHQRYLPKHRDGYEPRTLALVELAGSLPASAYIAGQRAREELTLAFEALLTNEVDVLLTPTTPITAPTIESVQAGTPGPSLAQNTWVFDLTSQPAISVPCGFDDGGLPIGVSLSGRKWADGLVLRAAHAYERATDWHQRRPEVGLPV